MVSGRGCSSRSTTTSGLPRRPGTVTGTSSSANRPASWAAPARCWERTASSSCSSREMSYSRRRFSAVSSIPPGTGWSLAAGGLAGPDEAVHQLDAAAADARCAGRGRSARRWTSTRRRPPRPRCRAPLATCDAAYSTACRPEPQRRSSWRPGTPRAEARVEGGDPADGRVLAAGVAVARGPRRRRRPPAAPYDAPARRGWSTPGRRRSGRTSAPPKRPTGVRTGSQITMSGMPSTVGRCDRVSGSIHFRVD